MKTLLATALLAVSAPSAAFAAVAVTLDTPGLEYGGGLYTLGFEFSVDQPGYVIDQLGVYDNLGDGLIADAQIGIWDLSGVLLASTTIAAGEGTLVNLFRFQDIDPLELVAGERYLIGSFTTDLASSLGTGQGGTGSLNSLVTFYNDRFSNFNSAFSIPDTTNDTGGQWLGANFNLSLANVVPEPASWAMMIAGFALVGGAMRMRSRNFRRVTA